MTLKVKFDITIPMVLVIPIMLRRLAASDSA